MFCKLHWSYPLSFTGWKEDFWKGVPCRCCCFFVFCFLCFLFFVLFFETNEWQWRWSIQHDTSMGQRKILSPRRELNPWPPRYRLGALTNWATRDSWAGPFFGAREFHCVFEWSVWSYKTWFPSTLVFPYPVKDHFSVASRTTAVETKRTNKPQEKVENFLKCNSNQYSWNFGNLLVLKRKSWNYLLILFVTI